MVAVRTFGTDDGDQALLDRALELSHAAMLALLWPERLDHSGQGQTQPVPTARQRARTQVR